MANRPESLPAAGLAPLEADLSRCVRCGMCLSSCPTYLETGLETEGPRGRIALMRAVQEGSIELTDRVAGHLEACIVCRACEDVCPSGVPFGRMMEEQRVQLRERRRDPLPARVFDRVFYRWLLPHRGRLWAAGRAGQVLGRIGVLAALRRLPLPGGLSGFVPEPSPRSLAPRYRPEGTPRGTVAVLEGCIMPLALARVNEATVRVLVRLGYEVVVPPGQGCCGALHAHRGYREQARMLARQTIAAFRDVGADRVVLNSAGCGAALKEYGELLHDDPEYAEPAAAFSSRVVDISELLAAEAILPGMHLAARVTWQESCHLGHAQRVKRQPKDVLRAIRGLELVEMAEADVCCGSGGVYTLLQPELSQSLLERTMRNVEAARAHILVTANPGCILQLEAGVRRRKLDLPVLHLVELVDAALGSLSAAPPAGMPPPPR